MLLAYVDESYDRDFYFIAAAIASQEAWDDVEKAVAEIQSRTHLEHGVPFDAELHGHEIMGGAGEWAPLRGKHREAAGVYAAALSAARTAGVEYIFPSPINFASSRLTPGLQIADLAVYLHHRRSTVIETHPAGARTVRRLSGILEQTIVHNLTWMP